MESVAGLIRKLQLLLHRQRFNRELEEELAFHREQVEQELRDDGMTMEDAHSLASRRLGNDTRWKEEAHDVIGFTLESVARDVRYAFRQLRKNAGFATTVVVILALGIGAITAIFSAVNPILFKPLPYPQANRVVMIWERQRDGSRRFDCFGTFHGVQKRTRSFDALAAMKAWQPTLVGKTQPERFEGQRVTTDYFRALGVEPVLGRNFEAADDQHKGPNVVILSDAVWHRRFGSDPLVVGQQVTLDGDPFTVIGIMPAGF